jgi:hypothetical protein
MQAQIPCWCLQKFKEEKNFWKLVEKLKNSWLLIEFSASKALQHSITCEFINNLWSFSKLHLNFFRYSWKLCDNYGGKTSFPTKSFTVHQRKFLRLLLDFQPVNTKFTLVIFARLKYLCIRNRLGWGHLTKIYAGFPSGERSKKRRKKLFIS